MKECEELSSELQEQTGVIASLPHTHAVLSSVVPSLIHNPPEALNQSHQFSLSVCTLIPCSCYFIEAMCYILTTIISSDISFPLFCHRQASSLRGVAYKQQYALCLKMTGRDSCEGSFSLRQMQCKTFLWCRVSEKIFHNGTD